MDPLREMLGNGANEAKVKIFTDIIEFPILDDKRRQDDGFRESVPDSRLKPLSVSHDAASV